MDVPRCTECGDLKPLNRSGVCRWRGGCEHRQMVHETRMHDLTRALALNDPVPEAPHADGCWVEQARNAFAMFLEEFEGTVELWSGGRTWWDGERWQHEEWGPGSD